MGRAWQRLGPALLFPGMYSGHEPRLYRGCAEDNWCRRQKGMHLNACKYPPAYEMAHNRAVAHTGLTTSQLGCFYREFGAIPACPYMVGFPIALQSARPNAGLRRGCWACRSGYVCSVSCFYSSNTPAYLVLALAA
jgi:hypothetical protein